MDAISRAFQKVSRENFVLPETKDRVEYDMPLPIGFGQTISQPTTVRMMLEWLGTMKGDKVLDIGSGSGWTTALLSQIVGPKGRVYAVEIVPELVEFGRKNCERAGTKNAEFHSAEETYGLPEFAPFDRILVSASAAQLPEELVRQLKKGGKLVVPVGNSILEITKEGKGYKTEVHHGFVFVPLIEK